MCKRLVVIYEVYPQEMTYSSLQHECFNQIEGPMPESMQEFSTIARNNAVR
jgi:hypothetical protein